MGFDIGVVCERVISIPVKMAMSQTDPTLQCLQILTPPAKAALRLRMMVVSEWQEMRAHELVPDC